MKGKSIYKHMCAQSLSCVLTLCSPMDYSPPGSSIHGIFQARILELVAISYSIGSCRLPNSGIELMFLVSCIGRQILYYCATWVL